MQIRPLAIGARGRIIYSLRLRLRQLGLNLSTIIYRGPLMVALLVLFGQTKVGLAGVYG